MKIKRWGVGLLSLAALLLSVSDGNAWWPFRGGYHCRLHCFETHITCRPYNAFTPICWGNLICDGVCPNPCGVASGCNMMPSWGDGMAGGMCGPGGCMPGFAGAPFAPNMGGMPGMAGAPLPQGQPAQGPIPPGFNQTTQYRNPAMYYGVQPAGYHPGYYYGYPASYYPNAYQQGYNPYANYPAMPYGYGYGYGYGSSPRPY